MVTNPKSHKDWIENDGNGIEVYDEAVLEDDEHNLDDTQGALGSKPGPARRLAALRAIEIAAETRALRRYLEDYPPIG